MLTCVARDCLSNQDTKVDRRNILFFPFPDDIAQRNQWIRNCQLDDTSTNDKPLYLCELHFEQMDFTSLKELKPNSVPTVFDKLEGQRKRKADSVPETELSKSPPLKQKKLNEDSSSLITPVKSPCTQLIANVEETNDVDKMDISIDHDISINGSALLRSELYHDVEIGKKQYRLTIQIDKIYGRPCPRSRKLMILAQLKKEKLQLTKSIIDMGQRDQSLQKGNRKAVCVKGGCKLKKSVYESKPAFQCEHCDKYYIMKKCDNPAEKNNICAICYKTFPSSQSLYLHTKTHFTCDMCQTECSSQVTYDKHVRLHVSTDPLYPYKCHQCTEIFELKEDARQHYLIVHPTIKLQNTILQVTASPLTQQIPQQQDYRCISCNITFRNEHAYRNHISCHKKKEGLRCSISETNNIFPVPNPLTGSQIGILRAVKFTCRVCSMEFDNVGEVDRHTRTHLEEENEEERKCNICKKLFKTSAQFNEHLKFHLSRTHSCPVCSKAFINRTTLKIHLKTHGEA
ncbi:zinc finger protein 808-like isoform X2 [Hylaeus volcanicus]|uniref:zinc finger protein 808-like isoform X2 n=1 Tax=Hylaeus volcanicus TaxID=313075 RepID=UPI0023B85024|nr:zinc finger protein 808-like isoform X2 [Hylaeus volcanicus]